MLHVNTLQHALSAKGAAPVQAGCFILRLSTPPHAPCCAFCAKGAASEGLGAGSLAFTPHRVRECYPGHVAHSWYKI